MTENADSPSPKRTGTVSFDHPALALPSPNQHSSREPQYLVSTPTRNSFDDPATVNSPSSVSSPPYWNYNASTAKNKTNGQRQTHQRTFSNVSNDSVLPSGAITLRDNESNEYSERNNACWAKSVEVKDHTIVNGSATNIGAFVVWIIRVETLSGSFMNIRKRYSEFDDFREKLVQSFPGFDAAVPPLPPKSVISKFRPRFLEKRRAGLQYFLNCILLNPEFSGSPVLKDFLFA